MDHDSQSTSAAPEVKPLPPVAIRMIPVESETLAAIGYHPQTQTLQVDFKANKSQIYQYHGVTLEFFQAFERAKSKGSFFYTQIKDKVAFTRFDRESGEVQKRWFREDQKEASPTTTRDVQ